MYRIEGGNDRLAAALAAPLGARVQLGTEVVAVSQRGRDGSRQPQERPAGRADPCDYLDLRAAGDAPAAYPDHAGAARSSSTRRSRG